MTNSHSVRKSEEKRKIRGQKQIRVWVSNDETEIKLVRDFAKERILKNANPRFTRGEWSIDCDAWYKMASTNGLHPISLRNGGAEEMKAYAIGSADAETHVGCMISYDDAVLASLAPKMADILFRSIGKLPDEVRKDAEAIIRQVYNGGI